MDDWGSVVQQHDIGQKPSSRTSVHKERSVTAHFLQADFWPASTSVRTGATEPL